MFRWIRRSDHPSRPNAMTCCFFSSFKTLLTLTEGIALASKSMSGTLLIVGRFSGDHVWPVLGVHRGIALAQIQQAVQDGVSRGVVLADEVYGSNREFREGVADLKLEYSLAVRSTTTVWALERQPLPPKPWKGTGPQPTRMRRDETHRPIVVRELARQLPAQAWHEVAWREGSQEKLCSRFAARRVRPAYGDH